MINAFYQNVLSSEVVGSLQNYALSADYQPVEQLYSDSVYQSTSVHRLPHGHPVEKPIVHSMMKVNSEYYNYDLFGTFEIQFLKYSVGGKYDWHCDYGVSEHPSGPRKLSLSIQLSSCWDYSGGDVVIKDWHDRENRLEREVGTIMVFDSRVPHKVMPILEGERYSVVAWAHGPQLR